MSEFVNRWYSNQPLIYKILLLLSTTLVIVYIFPKTGEFRYSFEKGKRWQSENLYAPFDFAIVKSAAEIQEETSFLEQSSSVFFDLDKSVKARVFENYELGFNETFQDSLEAKVPEMAWFEPPRHVHVDRAFDERLRALRYDFALSGAPIWFLQIRHCAPQD